MPVLTIIELKRQGRLAKGDRLHSSESGYATVAWFRDVNHIVVQLDRDGSLMDWEVDFGKDAYIQESAGRNASRRVDAIY